MLRYLEGNLHNQRCRKQGTSLLETPTFPASGVTKDQPIRAPAAAALWERKGEWQRPRWGQPGLHHLPRIGWHYSYQLDFCSNSRSGTNLWIQSHHFEQIPSSNHWNGLIMMWEHSVLHHWGATASLKGDEFRGRRTFYSDGTQRAHVNKTRQKNPLFFPWKKRNNVYLIFVVAVWN